jgi:hypothetical protein
MVQIIPPAVPSRATAGEKALFQILTALPDDVFVYYDVQIKHRYADFVVISPRLGVLMLEIKDWRAGSILSANNDTIEIQVQSGEKRVTHPVKQAREYAMALRDAIESRLEGRILMQQDGPYKGKIAFTISYAAVLSNISNEEIEARNLSHIFDAARTLTKGHLDAMRRLNGADLERFLAPYFVPKFNFDPLDQIKIDQLRGIIHPHIVVRSITQKLRDAYGSDDANFVSLLRVLDAKQEQKARNIGSGHRLLFGVAGSGKTAILVARAKYLAEQNPDQKGLVLCFNRPLSAYIKTQLDQLSNVSATTFHQLAFKFGIRDKDWDGDFGPKLKGEIVSKAERYDFILVDEAQDFDPGWFSCVVALLKDPIDGDLFITGDGSQGLYRYRSKAFSWKSEGIQAQGRTEYLHENYRNAQRIFQLATRFAGEAAFGEIDGEPNASLDQKHSVAGGGSVLFFEERDRAAEISKVVDLVSDLLDGTWGAWNNAISPKMEAGDIGVLYPSHRGREKLISEALIPRLVNECKVPVVWISDPYNDNRADFRPAIRIHTAHHAKGLQYRAIIFVWADLLPFPGSTLELDKRLFYVALSRAGQFLAIVHSARSSFVDEARTAMNTIEARV